MELIGKPSCLPLQSAKYRGKEELLNIEHKTLKEPLLFVMSHIFSDIMHECSVLFAVIAGMLCCCCGPNPNKMRELNIIFHHETLHSQDTKNQIEDVRN